MKINSDALVAVDFENQDLPVSKSGWASVQYRIKGSISRCSSSRMDNKCPCMGVKFMKSEYNRPTAPHSLRNSYNKIDAVPFRPRFPLQSFPGVKGYPLQSLTDSGRKPDVHAPPEKRCFAWRTSQPFPKPFFSEGINRYSFFRTSQYVSKRTTNCITYERF